MTESTEKCEKTNEKFSQIILEFKTDLLNTFPELEEPLKISDDEMFSHCSDVYPKIFFELLYENMNLFKEPRFLLPGVDFTVLMNENVSEKTKKTIWKYLQLILFSVVEKVDNKDSFGDTSKVFEAIKEEDLHKKIMETMDEMKNLFGTDFSSNMDVSGDFMDTEKIKSHLDGLMNGKIGSLAKEIATEASKELGDIENPEEFMGALMKNPKKIMDLVKNIGGKLEDKIKKGDLKESELLEEAKEIMEKMKDMPGMKEMMSKMGMGGKMDFKAMANKIQENLKMSKTKERLNKKREDRAKAKSVPIPEDVKVTQTSEDTFVVNVDGTKPKKSKGKKKKRHIKI
jgi:hypothetical protein